MESLKPQPSLRGFTAFALSRFVDQRGTTVAEGAAYMIERWVDDNYEMLADRYQITISAFKDYQLEELKKKQKGGTD